MSEHLRRAGEENGWCVSVDKQGNVLADKNEYGVSFQRETFGFMVARGHLVLTMTDRPESWFFPHEERHQAERLFIEFVRAYA